MDSYRRGGARMSRPKQAELYAALDLGTNNCRLLIARPARRGRFRIVDSYSHIVRLGEGLGKNGALCEPAIERTMAALRHCRARLGRRAVAHQRLVATEACRKAANSGEFLRRVRRETELELEIVDKETEARLAVAGCGGLVGQGAEAVILFDIGGGSTEIALLDMRRGESARLADNIVQSVSLPLGVVSLAERFGALALTQAGFARMRACADAALADFAVSNRFAALPPERRVCLLGASGTVTMLAGLALGLPRYQRARVDGLWLDKCAVERVLGTVMRMSMAEKMAHPCIGPGRADLILAGCAIMESVRALWPQGELRAADRGLREGILTELMANSGAWDRENGAKEQI